MTGVLYAEYFYTGLCLILDLHTFPVTMFVLLPRDGRKDVSLFSLSGLTTANTVAAPDNRQHSQGWENYRVKTTRLSSDNTSQPSKPSPILNFTQI